MNYGASSLNQHQQKNSHKMLGVIITYLVASIAQEKSLCRNDTNHQLHKADLFILQLIIKTQAAHLK